MPRYPEYQIHDLDTYGYGRIIQTIDGKFYDGWGNTVTFTLFGKEVSINVEGYETDTTDGGSVSNATNNTTNNTTNTSVDLFKDLQDQINSLKDQLNQQNTQLNQQLTTASYVLPGTIVMWGGSVNGIPTGWALCDGRPLNDESKLRNQLISQGYPFGYYITPGLNSPIIPGVTSPIIPDLRERFIVGAGGDNNSVIGSTYNVGDKGGVINNMLTLKNIPEHEHRFIDSWTFNIKYKNVDTPGWSSTQVVDTLDFTSYGSWKTTAFNLGSNRGIWNALPDDKSKKEGPGFTQKTINNVTDWYPNDPTPIENRPPYFALCFIIKL